MGSFASPSILCSSPRKPDAEEWNQFLMIFIESAGSQIYPSKYWCNISQFGLVTLTLVRKFAAWDWICAVPSAGEGVTAPLEFYMYTACVIF